MFGGVDEVSCPSGVGVPPVRFEWVTPMTPVQRREGRGKYHTFKGKKGGGGGMGKGRPESRRQTYRGEGGREVDNY